MLEPVVAGSLEALGGCFEQCFREDGGTLVDARNRRAFSTSFRTLRARSPASDSSPSARTIMAALIASRSARIATLTSRSQFLHLGFVGLGGNALAACSTVTTAGIGVVSSRHVASTQAR